MKTGESLNDIEIHPLIDLPEYRKNLKAQDILSPINTQPRTNQTPSKSKYNDLSVVMSGKI